MRNPFRGEPDAFRFLLLLIAASVPVAAAAALGPVWLVVTALAVVLAAAAVRLLRLGMLRRRALEQRLRSAPAHAGGADERRVLVVANDTLDEEGLAREIEQLFTVPGTHVLVLAPATVSSRGRWLGDTDRAREQAHVRLDEALGRIRDGLDVTGAISDADPLQAIEDALATFPADEIVVSTRPRDGLEPGLAALARERFALPVGHLVFEPDVQRTVNGATSAEAAFR